MPYFIIFISLFFINTYSFAQKPLQNDCNRLFSTYKEFYKIKYYNKALISWKKVFEECPEMSKSIYIDGANMMKHKIKNAKTITEKEMFTDSLMIIYDQRIIFFGDEAKIKGLKGIDLFLINKDKTKEAYDLMLKSLEQRGDKTDPAVVNYIFEASCELRKKNEITEKILIENYYKCKQHIDKQIATKSKKQKKLKFIKKNIDNKFKETTVCNCKNLDNFFLEKIQKQNNNSALINLIFNELNDSCYNTKSYLHTIEKQIEKAPSAEIYTKIARAKAENDEKETALKYYTKAEEIVKTDELRAEIHYEKAIILTSERKFKDAREVALKASSSDKYKAKANILIGKIYINSIKTFEGDEFQKSAIYWLAVDCFERAKKTDGKILSEAEKLIQTYNPYCPTKEEAFFRNLQEGKNYKIKGWINRTTKVRF